MIPIRRATADRHVAGKRVIEETVIPHRSLAPDLLLSSGTLHTMNANDFTATALAMKDGSIVGAGSDTEMLALTRNIHQAIGVRQKRRTRRFAPTRNTANS